MDGISLKRRTKKKRPQQSNVKKIITGQVANHPLVNLNKDELLGETTYGVF